MALTSYSVQAIIIIMQNRSQALNTYGERPEESASSVYSVESVSKM